MHCTALHCTTSASCFFTITLADLDYMQALLCTALHCTTSASCFFTIILADLDYMQALHCTALHYPRLLLLHHYRG